MTDDDKLRAALNELHPTREQLLNIVIGWVRAELNARGYALDTKARPMLNIP